MSCLSVVEFGSVNWKKYHDISMCGLQKKLLPSINSLSGSLIEEHILRNNMFHKVIVVLEFLIVTGQIQ